MYAASASSGNLILCGNSISGSIPTTIGSLTKLETVLLYDNSITGTIPTEIGTMTNLEVFDVHQNGLSGTIPTEIGMATNLLSLTISTNEPGLTGTIPTEMLLLTNLVRFSGFANYDQNNTNPKVIEKYQTGEWNRYLNSSHMASKIYACC